MSGFTSSVAPATYRNRFVPVLAGVPFALCFSAQIAWRLVSMTPGTGYSFPSVLADGFGACFGSGTVVRLTGS
jgi:hypothetical protein